MLVERVSTELCLSYSVIKTTFCSRSSLLKNRYKYILQKKMIQYYSFLLEWYSKTCVKRPLSKRPKINFQYQLSLNASQKYCRMLQGDHSAVLSTLSYHLSLRSLFCLFLSDRFSQVLLYVSTYVEFITVNPRINADQRWH